MFTCPCPAHDCHPFGHQSPSADQAPSAPRSTDRRRFLVKLVGLAGASVTVGCTADQLATLGPALAVSPATARQLGLETWQRILSEEQLSANGRHQKTVQDVGRRLVSTIGPTDESWEFIVLRGDQINAFAVPGGKIAFYDGIMDAFENEAQCAAVMGHEIGHVTAAHGAQRIGASQATQLGLRAVSAAMQQGDIQYANQIAGLLGLGVQFGVLLPYSRSHEIEADRLGVGTMARAGYDPREAVRFWRGRMGSRGGAPPEFLSTHPSDATRIANLEALMPQAMQIWQRRG